ncbi:site-specific integrase [Kitasatospora sp. NPDC057692]|uniref:site-specific integrase n=1 Tax=Kitasatospora sp. NPDC057692 TaxID=3346215 RepID=UPI0036A03F41
MPEGSTAASVRPGLLRGWECLGEREASSGVRPGDPIFLSPDYQVDPLLSRYVQSRVFRFYEVETKRNYATDIALLLTFLWGRGKSWIQATGQDLNDYEFWRQEAPENPGQIGGSKWNRELAAFTALYRWAKRAGWIASNPVEMREVVGRDGAVAEVPVARAKDARASNVRWLTPRTWRLWADVGLRGLDRDGRQRFGWAGRLEDRNVAFVRTVTSSGLRRQEAGSLLTFEVPDVPPAGARYAHGRVAAKVTRSKASRTFYVSAGAVGDVETYVESSRAWSVAGAQRAGRYDRLAGMRLVTEVVSGLKPRVRWVERDGTCGERELGKFTWQERILLFTEGPGGPEPLWLWLTEEGLPLRPHSWNGVFAEANRRCEEALAPPRHLRSDPHKVYWPTASPHASRHSFALYMLVVLNELMDRRYGLTAAERRDFRLLYGDPWFMVQGLLGHASRETTVNIYLAPVRHLQLASLLAVVSAPLDMPAPGVDDVFARVAREAEGIVDIDARLSPDGVVW